MGSNSSILLQKSEVDEISNETGFTAKQIKRLYSRFTALDKDNTGYLTRADFNRIPELNINPLGKRIIDVLLEDNGKNEQINFRQFANVFSTFRRNTKGELIVKNTREDKLKFLFSVYDRDRDDLINKEELLAILNMLVGGNLPQDQMNAIIDRTIEELSTNGSITFKQFCDTLQKIDIEDKMSMKFLT